MFAAIFFAKSFIYKTDILIIKKEFVYFLLVNLLAKGFCVMREPLLKAIAMPPRMFWAPFLPATINLALQFPLMFIGMGVFNMNPLIFIFPIVFAHLFLIVYGAREPHLSAMVQAYGPMAGGSVNIYKSKGTKLAP